jgi:hypothetical protein
MHGYFSQLDTIVAAQLLLKEEKEAKTKTKAEKEEKK